MHEDSSCNIFNKYKDQVAIVLSGFIMVLQQEAFILFIQMEY